MAQVDIRICNTTHRVQCEDGHEARLRHLAQRVDEEAMKIAGGAPLTGGRDAKVFLLTALMFADKLDEAEQGNATTNDKASKNTTTMRRNQSNAAEIAQITAERDEIAVACSELLLQASEEMDRMAQMLDQNGRDS